MDTTYGTGSFWYHLINHNILYNEETRKVFCW
jgi:hypothetical protein